MSGNGVRDSVAGERLSRADSVRVDLQTGVPYTRKLKYGFIFLGIAIVAAHWIRIGVRPQGDFPLHWELGRRLAAGEYLYTDGLDRPYPPFWALAHAPLSIVPMPVAQVLLFPLCIASAALLLWVLNRLTEQKLPLSTEGRFWAAAIACGLCLRFLIRDMLECGVNLALVALSWLAIYLWRRRQAWWSGISLGFAMSLKCTPALFWAYFVWKRQWKPAAITAAAAVFFSLSPALWMGPAEFQRTGGEWMAQLISSTRQPDPSQGILGPEPLQNISLRPAIARFLIHLPDGHLGRSDHPLYADFLNLPPVTAGLVVKALMLILLVGIAWRLRGSAAHLDDDTVCWECAAVSIMLLLYSPITWGQHCVGILPLLYLLSRRWLTSGLPGWTKGVLIVYSVFILGLNRGLIGRELSWLLDSYHIHTWCLLLLLITAVILRPEAAADAEPHSNSFRKSDPQRPSQQRAA